MGLGTLMVRVKPEEGHQLEDINQVSTRKRVKQKQEGWE